MTPFIPSRRPPPTEPATEYDYGANMRPMRLPVPNAQTGGGFPAMPMFNPHMAGGLPPSPMPHAQTGGGYAPRPSLVPQMAGGLPPSHMGKLWGMANGGMPTRQFRGGVFGLVR